LDNRFKFRNPIVEILAILEPARQFLFCRRQPLALRVFEDDHEIIILSHSLLL
jgi:hypothetical protein